MAESEDESYIFIGTAIQDEVETRAGQHHKTVQDPALTKSLPVWKQEVTDAEGRRRFHGAFTGGYSAGFFNTVGSLEGWEPKTFKSTRDKRASDQQQNVEDFMDEEELADLRKTAVKTTANYDTFGDTAAEMAQKAASADAQARPSIIPGAIFKDLLTPVPDSIGVKLLQKMGWRQGKGIGSADAAAGGQGSKGSRWGRVAGVGVENTPLHLLAAKENQYGLGFDPFKNAEVFRAAKGAAAVPSKPATGVKRTRGVAFGSGAADEDDSYGMMEDYVSNEADPRKGMLFEIAGDSDEEDLPYVMGRRQKPQEPFRLTAAGPTPLAIQSRQHGKQAGAFIPGFVRGADNLLATSFPPPQVPASYQPVHKFDKPLQTGMFGRAPQQAAPAVPAPANEKVLHNINTLARYVSKSGPAFEEIARQRNTTDPAFAFLRGGEGAAYYAWKVQQLASASDQAQSASTVARRSKPLSADDRGSALGETALPSDAPTPSAPLLIPPPDPIQYVGFVPSGSQSARPNLTGIAEGDRSRLKNLLASSFQQPSTDTMSSQKDTLQAGLQSRASVTALAAGKGVSSASAQAMAAAMADRFASGGASEIHGIPDGGLQLAPAKPPPATATALGLAKPLTRTVEDWRPAPLLCKRFNVMDPYKGKAERPVQMSRFKTDYLTLPDTMAAIAESVHTQATAAAEAPQLLPGPPLPQQGQPASLPPPQQPAQLGQMLPPPPRRPTPAQEAKQDAPATSSAMADAFLSSLGMGGAADAAQPTTVGTSAQTSVTAQQQPTQKLQQQAALEKPIDLFKAIFEDEDSSEEEDSEDDKSPDEPLPALGPAPAPISALPFKSASQLEPVVRPQTDRRADQQCQQGSLSQAQLREPQATAQQHGAAQQRLDSTDAAGQQQPPVWQQQEGSGTALATDSVAAAGRESDSASESDVDRGKAHKKQKHKRDSKHKHRKSKHSKKHKSDKHKGHSKEKYR